MINDILDFSKIEAGKLDIESIETDVRGVVDDVLSTVDFTVQSKGLKLVVDVQSAVPVWALGDPQRIRQCLLNLLGNAIKFTRAGEVAVSVSAVPMHGVAGSRVRFEVRDTGIGIAPESLKALFQPFVQADSSTTRHFGGTGLGLSIVRGLVEKMGGEIGADSSPGSGSTFWFELPMGEVLSSAPAPVPRRSGHWAAQRFSGRVLLVEDNVVNQKVGQRFLERLGCQVELAANGEDAVQAWERGEYRIIFMDIQMPVMDGYMATQCIRERECANGREATGERTPIVALTANAMTGQLERCLSAGMDGLRPSRSQWSGFVRCSKDSTWVFLPVTFSAKRQWTIWCLRHTSRPLPSTPLSSASWHVRTAISFSRLSRASRRAWRSCMQRCSQRPLPASYSRFSGPPIRSRSGQQPSCGVAEYGCRRHRGERSCAVGVRASGADWSAGGGDHASHLSVASLRCSVGTSGIGVEPGRSRPQRCSACVGATSDSALLPTPPNARTWRAATPRSRQRAGCRPAWSADFPCGNPSCSSSR